eukprot:s61_g13.t1
MIKECKELMIQHENLGETNGYKRGPPCLLPPEARWAFMGKSKDCAAANQSNCTMEGIERTLKTSFYDLHEKERQRDQFGVACGCGRKVARFMNSYAVTSEAPGDGEVFQAFIVAMDQQRPSELYVLEKHHAIAAKDKRQPAPQQQQLFSRPDGSHGKEWNAWKDNKACQVRSLEES